ncbi:MAG: hypothetical protein IH820_01015 [Bacteroidetes bacterium]|nr:hypothetical protein [Bacteroidota bacterium]
MRKLRMVIRYTSVIVVALLAWGLLPDRAQGQGAPFEEVIVDVGNVGLTVTNVGFFGKANVRNNPDGPPSFEYPIDSGIEHLIESGLWIGAVRSDGVVSVRTATVINATGYRPGQNGYEFAPLSRIGQRSLLIESDAFTREAVSHQDYLATFVDTVAVLPGTFIPMPDPQGRLGAEVHMSTYAWNFPFTEYFVILNFDIVNISAAAWDSVYVGLYHNLVVRNVKNRAGGFFGRGGFGSIDSLTTMYAFNAGGQEETLNTYGAVAVLGAEWREPRTGLKRFFHPAVADEYVRDGYAPPTVNPRWWHFFGTTPETAPPSSDEERFRRMATPFPNPATFETPAAFERARQAWVERLKTDGLSGVGNWIGMTPLGPFSRVEAGDTLQVTFALVAALKPDKFQEQSGKSIDNEESRTLLVNNLRWARRTYFGEDNNFSGVLDPGEDVNGNGRLDRYLIPEPPRSPRLRVELEPGRALLYWDTSSETSRDSVTSLFEFEGYRVYRTNPGDDLTGNILDRATLVAQYDRPGNRTGFNNGFDEVRLPEPFTFDGDPVKYEYLFVADGLLSGWQYLFIVTAFARGDVDAGLESFESSRTANATRVFPGTPAAGDGERPPVGVYPNPYRVNAAWDGGTSRTRRLNFYNLPPRSEVRIYTLAGEVVAQFEHDERAAREAYLDQACRDDPTLGDEVRSLLQAEAQAGRFLLDAPLPNIAASALSLEGQRLSHSS